MVLTCENVQNNMKWVVMSKDFLEKSPKAQETKAKIDK
jgi:hypothetical protein